MAAHRTVGTLPGRLGVAVILAMSWMVMVELAKVSIGSSNDKT